MFSRTIHYRTRGDITYSVVQENETNILQKLTYVHLGAKFYLRSPE
jgi:hypothetical protein